FTLVEALTAIVILAFGLMAVTNLLLVAASSNTVANQSTAATNSASHVMDVIKATPWATLPTGGDITVTTPPSQDCLTATAANFACQQVIPGVGQIFTRWSITNIPGTGRLRFIQVRSEGTGALVGARSRAEFTSFRSCTTTAAGCPAAP